MVTKPKIYIFAKTSHGKLGNTYQTLAEDGTPLGSHISSDEYWVMIDIQSHSEDFEKHYPDGYELELIAGDYNPIINDDNPRFHNALRANGNKYGKQNFDHPRNARIEVVWVDDDGKEFLEVIE